MDRAFRMLGSATDLLVRALAIQGIWVLGTLAGGIVLGWAPATTAAVDAAARAAHGEPIRLSRAARAWTEGFWRSQVTLGVPGLLLLIALVTISSGLLPAPALIAVGLLATLLVVTLGHIPEVDRRHALRTAEVFGAALRLALAQAPTSLLLLAVLALCAGALVAVPGLIPFLGVAVPLLATQHLVGRSLDRNEDLLAAAEADPDPPPPHRGRRGDRPVGPVSLAP